jgi:hypothetical protein
MKYGETAIRIRGRSSGLPLSVPRQNGPPGMQTMPSGASWPQGSSVAASSLSVVGVALPLPSLPLLPLLDGSLAGPLLLIGSLAGLPLLGSGTVSGAGGGSSWGASAGTISTGSAVAVAAR